MVELFFEETDVLDLNPELFVSWLSNVCSQEGRALQEVSIVFCSDEYLLKINREYLSHDYYTDIITFDYYTEDISGDLFISVDRVRDNAKKNAVSFDNELKRVVVHGVLHLLGYGDKLEEEALLMRKKEDEALKLL